MPNVAKPADILASADSGGVEAGVAVLDEFSAVLGDLSDRQAELLAYLHGLRTPPPDAAMSAAPADRPLLGSPSPVGAEQGAVGVAPGTVGSDDAAAESVGRPAGESDVGPGPRFAASPLRFVPAPAPAASRPGKPKRDYDYFAELDARIDRLSAD